MPAKKILVTGGYGNLGSWLVRHLAKAGESVTVLAARKRSFLETVPHDFLACDLSNYSECQSVLRSKAFDWVLHLASFNEPTDWRGARKALDVNAWGTRNLLAALQHQPPERLVYFSTFQVYGTYEGTVDELHPLHPRNDYALTHLFAEQYIQTLGDRWGIPWTILRLTNSYGCPLNSQTSKWYLLFNDLCRMALEKGHLQLRSNGRAQRDFISMRDVCQWVYRICGSSAATGTFNMSFGESRRLVEVAEEVQLAWMNFSGQKADIELNREDDSAQDEPLIVEHTSLQKQVPLELEHCWQEEAIAVFELLQNQKMT